MTQSSLPMASTLPMPMKTDSICGKSIPAKPTHGQFQKASLHGRIVGFQMAPISWSYALKEKDEHPALTGNRAFGSFRALAALRKRSWKRPLEDLFPRMELLSPTFRDMSLAASFE